jgi:isopenicillin N synthase-like dioxygenase
MSLNIPTLDISQGFDSPALIEELSLACEQWGFFQIIGHGIDPDLRSQFFTSVTKFFEMKKSEKVSLSRTQENFWGYYDKELTKNRLDKKEIFDIDANLDNLADSTINTPVPWPNSMPELESISKDWLHVCEVLNQQLLGAICLCLGESIDALNPFFIKQHSSFLRFNYYPALDSDDFNNSENLGIHPHTDAGALTLLAHDIVPGLQVYKGDTWHTIIPIEDSFIVNIGDMIQVWSNDRFKAPLHRVLKSSVDPRYSAPYFYNPSYATICKPLLANSSESVFNPVPWQEFRSGRAAGDYADQGEEIQISWYRK